MKWNKLAANFFEERKKAKQIINDHCGWRERTHWGVFVFSNTQLKLRPNGCIQGGHLVACWFFSLFLIHIWSWSFAVLSHCVINVICVCVQMVRVLVWRRWNAFDCQAKSSYMSEWAHHISFGWAQVCTPNEHTNEMRTTTTAVKTNHKNHLIWDNDECGQLRSFSFIWNEETSSAAIASCHLCLNDRAVPSTRMKDQQGKRIAFFSFLCNIMITTSASAAAAAATT